MAGRKGNAEVTAPARVRATLETQRRAAELRGAGATYREIGRQLDIDPKWAYTLVVRALEQSTYESAEVMRAQEGERLDRLQRAQWTAALRGNVPAARTILRIMERRARLFGLDHADEVAERQLELAESQAQLLADGVVRLLDRLGLSDDDDARAAAADMLSEVARLEIEGSSVLDVEIIEGD